MKYTLRSGVAHPYSEKFTDNLRFVLPLLAILLLILYMGLTHSIQPRQAHKPLTLGIYTIKTSSSGGSGSGSNTGGGSPSGGGNAPVSRTAAASYQPVSPVTSPGVQGSSSLITNASSSTQTTSSQVQGSSTTTTSSTPTAPTTFPCVDATTGLTVTCTDQACTPAVALTPGQKALLTTTGACVVVN